MHTSVSQLGINYLDYKQKWIWENSWICFKLKIIIHQEERIVSLNMQICDTMSLCPKKTHTLQEDLFWHTQHKALALERYHGFNFDDLVHKLFLWYILIWM